MPWWPGSVIRASVTALAIGVWMAVARPHTDENVIIPIGAERPPGIPHSALHNALFLGHCWSSLLLGTAVGLVCWAIVKMVLGRNADLLAYRWVQGLCKRPTMAYLALNAAWFVAIQLPAVAVGVWAYCLGIAPFPAYIGVFVPAAITYPEMKAIYNRIKAVLPES